MRRLFRKLPRSHQLLVRWLHQRLRDRSGRCLPLAKGEAIPGGGGGGKLQIKVPLDWYVVSDHAEYLGGFRKMEDPESAFSKLPIAKRITSDDQKVAFEAYSEVLNRMSAGESNPALTDPETSNTIWQEVVETADKHYQPGRFTTFPGFEWTSNPGKQNLHRVVIFEGSTNVPASPFSALDSDKPEDLWVWMQAQRAALRNLSDQGQLRNASAPLTQRRVCRIRALGLHPFRRCPAA